MVSSIEEKSKTEETDILPEIDGFELIKLIGKGSVGSVYEAKNDRKESVAIKVMELTPFLTSSVLDSIIESAILTKKISKDANIVEVFDTGKFKDYYFITMKLFRNGTLEKLIADTKKMVIDKLRICISLAQTLSLVHAAGIIHADLKPSNTLLSDSNQPYLIDFYHATKRRSEFGSMPQGTPQYMSPEQSQGRFISFASDIYSFGVLSYELLTGASPYPSTPDNINSMVKLIQNNEIVPLRNRNSRVSSKIEAVIMKTLQKNPENRYEDMNQVTADLQACLDKTKLSIPYSMSFMEKIKSAFS